MQHRLPAFQAPASDSLETNVLSRLAQTGEYLPDDLPRLARLAVLNSISMLVNVRADLPDSLGGEELGQQITALWNDSQAFYDCVNNAPLDDFESLELARDLLAAVSAGHRRVQSTLGVLPGLSGRAATDLQSFSRLLGHVDSLVETLESNASSQTPPSQAAASPASLRRQAQIAANLLVDLIARVGAAGRDRPEHDALIADLTATLDRLQRFCRLLSLDPSLAETQSSFRDARRRPVASGKPAAKSPTACRARGEVASRAESDERDFRLSRTASRDHADRYAAAPCCASPSRKYRPGRQRRRKQQSGTRRRDNGRQTGFARALDEKLVAIPSGSSVKSPATPMAARSSARLPGP